jgi:hypothetical protein
MSNLIAFIKRHPQITFWGISYLTFLTMLLHFSVNL